MKLYHFSKIDSDNLLLDPKRIGKNAYSARELAKSDVPRVFFYSDLSFAETQVKNLNPFLYSVEVDDSEIYSLESDPLNLKEKALTSAGILDVHEFLKILSGWKRIGKSWEKNKGYSKGLEYVSQGIPIVVWFEPVLAKREDLIEETKEHQRVLVPLSGLIYGELGEMERRKMVPNKLKLATRAEKNQELKEHSMDDLYEPTGISVGMNKVSLMDKNDSRKDYQKKVMKAVKKNVESRDIHDPPSTEKIGSMFGSKEKGWERFSLKEWLEEELNEFNAIGGGNIVGMTAPLGSIVHIDDPEKPEEIETKEEGWS